MILRKAILGTLVTVVSACGGNSGGGGSDSPSPTPTGSPGEGNLEDETEGKENFYRVEVISNQEGEKVPITKLPSMLEDGKWLDTCKEGQIYFEDHCYESVHIVDNQPGFALSSPTKNYAMTPIVERGWKDNFVVKESFGADTFSFKHRITWKCGFGTMGCEQPTPVGRKLTTRTIDGVEYIDGLYVFTHYFWGGYLPPVCPHNWFVNGTIELNGKVYNLPITGKDFKEAYGKDTVNHRETVINGYVTAEFHFLSSDLYGVEVPPNLEDRPLQYIIFTVDNSQREQDLRNPDNS